MGGISRQTGQIIHARRQRRPDGPHTSDDVCSDGAAFNSGNALARGAHTVVCSATDPAKNQTRTAAAFTSPLGLAIRGVGAFAAPAPVSRSS